MTDLIVAQNNLPASIEDLSKFVLVGRDKLQAVRAEISAMKSLNLAKEVREQKLREGQEIGKLVLLAEARLGELFNQMPKQTNNNPAGNNQFRTNSLHEEIDQPDVETPKPKLEVAAQMGFNKNQVAQFQKLADNPDAVQKAIDAAKKNDEIVTRSKALDNIKANDTIDEEKKIPIQQNTGNNERYTPKEYIDAAREVLGTIDLDPASSELANQTVKATKIYTAQDDGLQQEWFGNIWLNPPYAKDLLPKFAEKFAASNFNQAIVLVHNATETRWFLNFIRKASAIVFPTGRVDCKTPGENRNTPLQGSALIYVGNNAECFLEVFSKFGWRARL